MICNKQISVSLKFYQNSSLLVSILSKAAYVWKWPSPAAATEAVCPAKSRSALDTRRSGGHHRATKVNKQESPGTTGRLSERVPSEIRIPSSSIYLKCRCGVTRDSPASAGVCGDTPPLRSPLWQLLSYKEEEEGRVQEGTKW